MSHLCCARLNCNRKNRSESWNRLPDRCKPVGILYSDQANPVVCTYHYQEAQSIFPEDSYANSYRWEYDLASGTVDYCSRRKTARKAPCRVFSIRPTCDDANFLIVDTLCDNVDVSETWNVDKYFDCCLTCPGTPESKSSSDSFSTPVHQSSIQNPSITVSKRKYNSDIMPSAKLWPNVNFSVVEKLRQAFFEASSNELGVRASSNMLKSESFDIPSPPLELAMPDSPSSKSDAVPFLISIEGNIGAGKSTLLKALRKIQHHWCFIDEPIDTWTSLKNEGNVSLLELFYHDQRRWSYTFQNCAILSRYQNIESTVTKTMKSVIDRPQIFVTERCLDTDHFVFAKMMHGDGKMDKLEFALYQRWYNMIMKTATPLSAIIYVDTEPELCNLRIKGRAREGEESIPLDYLELLNSYQNSWINSSNVPCIRVTSTCIEKAINFVESLVSQRCSSPQFL